jgi:hypothetical protein
MFALIPILGMKQGLKPFANVILIAFIWATLAQNGQRRQRRPIAQAPK